MIRSPADATIFDDTVYGAHHLRRFLSGARKRLQGGDVQLVLGFIGDSWVRGSGLPALGDASRERYFMPRLTAALQRCYGDAGGGWCGLSYPNAADRRGGSANSNRLYQAGIGSWSTHANRRPVPDLCTSASSVAGDTIRVTNTTGPTSGVKLHYIPGGTIDYRWNEGAWTRLELDERAGAPVVALTGFPLRGGWTLDLRVASGAVELAGIAHDSGTPGIVVHNLGAGGSSAQHWHAVDADQWRAAIASFGFDTVLTLFGTNDQKLITPEDHRRCLAGLVRALRLAVPNADIALGTSPENGDTDEPRPGRPMRLYCTQARSLAIEARLCHVDLQPAFGNVADYRYGGPKPMLDRTLIHPSAPGMQAIEALYLRLLARPA